MHIIKSAQNLSKYLSGLRNNGDEVTVGFVPTMGALHEGHASLVAESVDNNTVTVCSIFVNPTQFGESKDLTSYPKPIENDIEMLINLGCDILFLPEYEDVYPKSYTHVKFKLQGLDLKIEGASRPGHFQGVCNVLTRFFEIIEPTRAYFGQKDFQQSVVVKYLVKLLNSPIEVVVVPIKREPHGLAMSSRNVRLSDKGRQNAAFIYRSLTQLKADVNEIGLKKSLEKAAQFIEAQKGARLDYLVAVDSNTLEEVEDFDSKIETAVLTVVEYEGVRLLDNIIL